MVARRRRETRFVMISTVAERLGVHPQTLRMYEREGLLTPVRSAGNTRLYDEDTIKRLETILFLTRELGVNLAGVEVILNLRQQMSDMQLEVDRLLQQVREQLRERGGIRREHALVKIEHGPLVQRDSARSDQRSRGNAG
ncbi:MAG TPA: MerR family transcriptional regulator [Thermoanaerobaculia bacterium]|jgi:MerR family transcriptional regulator/heat shock protein HspR|nr:MerR family transcriptional regulator [Thermoanaerobaculia bacterium]